jgi:hypothetical protein
MATPSGADGTPPGAVADGNVARSTASAPEEAGAGAQGTRKVVVGDVAVGEVAVGEVAVGEVVDSDLPGARSRIETELLPQIKRCYQAALATRDPALEGRATLSVVVTPGGRVDSVRWDGLSLVNACVEASARRLTFEEARRAQNATITVSLVFTREEIERPVTEGRGQF